MSLSTAAIDRALIGRLSRFATVGGAAAALQTALLYLLVDTVGIYYLVGAIIAIEVTIVSQYVINDAWTFSDRPNGGGTFFSGLLRTNLVRGSAIPLQTGLLYLLVAHGDVGYLAANLCAIVPSGLYRYALDARWTWRTPPEES
jgi:putative flippase GtrA